MNLSSEEKKEIDDLIQAMRLCTLAQIRAELEEMKKNGWGDAFNCILSFYQRAFRQKNDSAY